MKIVSALILACFVTGKVPDDAQTLLKHVKFHCRTHDGFVCASLVDIGHRELMIQTTLSDSQFGTIASQAFGNVVEACRIRSTLAVGETSFIHILSGLPTIRPAALLPILDDERIVFVEVESVMTASELNRQHVASDLWNLGVLDSPDFHNDYRFDYRQTGKNVSVHILDTGLNIQHDELVGRAEVFHVASSLSEDCPDNLDCHGHGTHVAGIVAGRHVGVAKDAYVYSSKVLGRDGTGKSTEIVAAIVAVFLRHDARGSVMVLSLGGPDSLAIKSVVNGATNRGMIVVVAAGNRDMDACSESPANSPQAITVGSHGRTGERSRFSNHGTCVDFYAPGEHILSTFVPSSNSYAWMQGTSMSAPAVAGVVALILEQNMNLNTSEIKKLLEKYSKTRKVRYTTTGSALAVSSNVNASPCDEDDRFVCVALHATLKQNQSVCSLMGSCLTRKTTILPLNLRARYWPLFTTFRPSVIKLWAYTDFLLDSVAGDVSLIVKKGSQKLVFNSSVATFDVPVGERFSILLDRRNSRRAHNIALFIQLPRHCADSKIVCGRHGICNHDTGLCSCPRGFVGFDCSKSEWAEYVKAHRGWWYKWLTNDEDLGAAFSILGAFSFTLIQIFILLALYKLLRRRTFRYETLPEDVDENDDCVGCEALADKVENENDD